MLPPVFGKEASVINNLRQLNPVVKFCLIIIAVLLSCSGFGLYSAGSASIPASAQMKTPVTVESTGESIVTIELNGRKSLYTYENLFSNMFSVSAASLGAPESDKSATSDPALVNVAALAEILPLILDLWEFTVSDTSGNIYDLLYPRSADFLFETYLYRTETGISLVHCGTSVEQVDTITLKGDLLPEKPLEVWLDWEGTTHLKAIIDNFAQHYALKIKTNIIPGIDTKLITHNRGNMKIPDVVMVQSDYLPKLISEQALQPIVWELPDALQPQGIEAFTSNRLYAVPFYNDVQILCWNPEIINNPYESAVNEFSGTLEMLEKSLASVKSPLIPATWNIYSAYWLMPFQMGFGKSAIVEDDGSITVDDAATADALKYLMHLVDSGLVRILERDGMVSQFIQGNAGVILTGSYALPGFIDLGIPFEVTVYPINRENGAYVSPLIDYKGFSIPKRSRNPVGARRLIEYLTSPRVQAEFAFSNFKNPARNDIWELSTLPEHINNVLKESVSRGSVIPPEPAYLIAKDTMWKIIRLIISRQLTVEDGLRKAQEIIDNQLKRFNRVEK